MVKDKLIDNSKYRILTKLVVETCLKMEDEGRLGTYKRLGTMLPRKSYKRILPIVDNTIEEVLHLIIGTSYDNLYDRSLQNQIKTYYQSVNLV
jgi:hypothetical protein